MGPTAGLDGCGKSRPNIHNMTCISGVTSLKKINLLSMNVRAKIYFSPTGKILQSRRIQYWSSYLLALGQDLVIQTALCHF